MQDFRSVRTCTVHKYFTSINILILMDQLSRATSVSIYILVSQIEGFLHLSHRCHVMISGVAFK